MTAELAEPRIGVNIPRPFPHMHDGIWERDYMACDFLCVAQLLIQFRDQAYAHAHTCTSHDHAAYYVIAIIAMCIIVVTLHNTARS